MSHMDNLYDLDILVWKWCTTHHHSMSNICVTYEANWSNRHRAIGPGRRHVKTRMGCMTLIFDLLTWKRCVILCTPMCCICVTNKMNRLKRHGATDQTRQTNYGRPMRPLPLTFRPENNARFIATSWVVFMSHMKRFGLIGKEPRSGYGKKWNDPLDLDLWPLHLGMMHDTSPSLGLCYPCVNSYNKKHLATNIKKNRNTCCMAM